MKTCKGCCLPFDLEQFYRHPQTKDGRQNYCKPCFKRRRKVRTDRNRLEMGEAAWKERERQRNWKKTYGISGRDYGVLFEAQHGACAICGLACKTGKALSVDHSHVTGKVRGLLCQNCNTGIGQFQDNPRLLLKAAEYLGWVKATG